MNHSNYYINPKIFEAKLAKYAETRCVNLKNELCRDFFYPMAQRLCAKKAWGRPYYDDLVQICVEQCMDVVEKTADEGGFNSAKGSPFNFFTRIVINKIKDGCRKEGAHAARYISYDDPDVLDWVERGYS